MYKIYDKIILKYLMHTNSFYIFICNKNYKIMLYVI